MNLVSLIADQFSNKSFDKFREAITALKENNRQLLENGVQQAKDLGAEIKRLTDELSALQSSSQTEIEAVQALLKTKESSLKDAEEESELLLLQLHQVQEELESVFLKEQETQGQLDKTLKRVKEREQQVEALALEKSTLQAGLDQEAKEAAEGKQQIQTLTQAIEKLKAENVGLAEQVEQYKTGVQQQFKEAQDENELLLLQLHQVQEELEHYFLEFQRLQRENETFVSRWQRLEDRLPNYLDFESIIPTAVDAISDNPRIEWSVKDVLVGGVLHADFQFATFMEDGLSGIELLNSQDQAQSGAVRLVPRALLKPQAVKIIAEFRNMSALHWRQIQVAISCVENFFQDPSRHAASQKLPENFDMVFWRQISAPLIGDVRALPTVFRFNKTKLKRELIHPDYEHLWLEIYDATYGDKHWPKLELRLGAANIQPGAFSRYPKIELPRIDGKTSPFASWFEESFDDFGGKLELRFDLNKQLFDLGVWIKLTNEDQTLLLSIIGVLPLLLKALEQDKIAIGRPWDSWSGLVSGLINVMRKRLDEASEVLKQQDLKKDADQAVLAAPLESVQAEPTTTKIVPASKTETVENAKLDKGADTKVDKLAGDRPQNVAPSAGKSARYVPARAKKSRGR